MDRIHLAAALSVVILLSGCCLTSLAWQELDLGRGLREDAAALLDFRRGISKDPSGALREWGVDPNPCRWRGVECAHVAAASRSSEQEPQERVVSLVLGALGLEGSISSQIGRLSELGKLVLAGNKLTGQIPGEIRNCRKLSTMDLQSNGLSGDIAFSLADLPSLEILKLSKNRLTGTLSPLFVEERKLETFDTFHVLDALNSKETGRKGLCRSLEVLDLAHNSLFGAIPGAVGRCSHLLEVSLNDNSFSGGIPTTLSSIPRLRSLLLNKNHLSGTIPSAIPVGCKELQFLNVADNVLRGQIPAEFVQFRGTRYFNFSNNRLHGPIPLGKWRVQKMALDGSFSSNPGLCGWPLSQVCSDMDEEVSRHLTGHLIDKILRFLRVPYDRLRKLGKDLAVVHSERRTRLAATLRTRRSMADASSPVSSPAASPAAPPSHKNKHTARKWGLGLALGIVAGAIAAAILVTFLRLCISCMHKATYLQGPIIFHPNISPKMLLFLEQDESLSEAELVGEGGAGRVYKAQLENEMVVAVKSVLVKEDQKGIFGQKQIQAELETLGCIRHRNLVVLLAYVHRADCHLLLYEYMQNGSLHQCLQRVNAGEMEIPWPIRHRIAVGTATGLSYLHFHSKPRIVHRDLKPSNILLDVNFEAHVSDFGLAKVIPGADTHVTTGVAGTVGYIAPEYSQTCRFTDRSDVYSFGVVLAVLLTGKDPTDQFFHTVPGGSIGTWLHDLLQKGEGKDAIDPKIRKDEYEEETLLAMKIAVFCTNVNPSERPSSKEVLIMLNQIRHEEPVLARPQPG